MRSSLEFFLGFVAIEISRQRYTELLPEVSPAFVRAEANVGKVSPTYASLPNVFLEIPFPLEFSLGFAATAVSLWRCAELLPEVSPVFVCAEAIVEEVASTDASRPEVFLCLCFPLDFSLGFVAIEVSLWRCIKLLPEVSPVFLAEAIVGKVSPPYTTPHEFPLRFVIIEFLFGRSLVIVCATRLTRMPAGYVTGVVQGR